MAQAKKAKITLGNIALAGKSAIAWRFVSGVAPYVTTFSVPKEKWDILKTQIGEPLNLKIVDSRGVETSINQVYILHQAPSDSPHRVSFVVADKRWKWRYKLVARDFNMPRKTGDRTALNTVPVETQTVVDKYDYLPYSLTGDQGTKWTAKQVIEEVLDIIHPRGSGGFKVDSWPIKDSTGEDGEFTIQGVTLRDAGDVALSRALSYCPGADVYVDADGRTVVYDATDLDALKSYYEQLPIDTYAGEAPCWIDRKKIRPKKIVVHYQREIEVGLDYEDDYSGNTSARPSRDAPYLENVAQTVDPETVIGSEFDPETNQNVPKTVPPGTWVEMKTLLAAWDDDKPEGSLPWNFDTIKRHWLKGDLEGVLGARGKDRDDEANIAMRVQSLRQHFRQTFRVNRRFMERTRSFRAVRVGLLDPVTGARAPAAVWGQATSIPSTKGKSMARRGTDEKEKLKYYRIIDGLAKARAESKPIISTPPTPARVNVLDEDLGIFRLEWIASPYGTIDSFVPCKLASVKQPTGDSPVRDLAQQDTEVMGPGMEVEGGTNGIFLAPRMQTVVLLTLVPSAPNNEKQFHREEVTADDISDVFRSEFGIKAGDGPDLEVFVPPGEATARFAMVDEYDAYRSIGSVFGMSGDPSTAGVEGPEIPGYQIVNQDRHLTGHALSLGAELLAQYADNVMGSLVTRVPEGKLELKGNTSDITIRIGAAPSAKVDAVHTFPGQQRQLSRLAVMPESTRQVVLGIVAFK